jgi:tetratricopeptide (TPR) repeat protein
MNESLPPKWAKMQVLSGFLMPVAVVVIGSLYTNALKQQEILLTETVKGQETKLKYIELATGILRQQDNDESTRSWALEIINKYSDVKLDSAVHLKIAPDSSALIIESKDFIALGRKHANNADYASAINAYDQAINRDPYNPEPLNLKGYALYRLGQYDKSIEVLTLAIRLNPYYIWPYYVIALPYMKTGQINLAAHSVIRCLENSPSLKERYLRDGEMREIIKLPQLQSLFEN